MRTALFLLFLTTFSLVSVLLLVSSSYAASLAFSLSPDEGNVNRGCSFSVDILIDAQEVPDTDSEVNLNLSFDNTRLEVIDIVNGDAFDSYLINSFDNQKGKIIIKAQKPSESIEGSAVVSHITFKVLEEASDGKAQVIFQNIEGKDVTAQYSISSGPCDDQITKNNTQSVTTVPDSKDSAVVVTLISSVLSFFERVQSLLVKY